MGREQRLPPGSDAADDPVRIERLTESYRFDGDLATVLTDFQYRADGIALTASERRPVPTASLDAPTAGLDSVFTAGASLVFVCYDARGQRMVNPIETSLIDGLVATVETPTATMAATPSARTRPEETESSASPSLGVVTPHNAQRGALETALPEHVTTNTVEKYQGGERDIIVVSGTVSDPAFARHEERFILNPRRLLVAISRSRLLTIVVCSTALFEVVPEESNRLDDGPVWARLFTQAVGRDAEPVWAGPLGEFTGKETDEHAAVPVRVYPSTIDGGDS
jgi:hypothetical protein